MAKKNTTPDHRAPEGYTGLPGKGLISDKFLKPNRERTPKEKLEYQLAQIKLAIKVLEDSDPKNNWMARLAIKGLEDAETFLNMLSATHPEP
mgnify:CR=1 FL=1